MRSSLAGTPTRLCVALLNTKAHGMYTFKCGFKEVSRYQEAGLWFVVMEKHHGDVVIQEEEAQQEAEQRDLEEDHNLDDDEAHEEVCVALVGNILTAVDVWLKLIKMWVEISKPVDGTDGDYDRAQLEAYADRCEAAGIAWALSIQKHTDNRSSWQYVHDCFAHVRLSPLTSHTPPPLTCRSSRPPSSSLGR